MTTELYPFELDVCARCESTFRRPTKRMVACLAITPTLRVRYRVKVGDRRAKYFDSLKGAYRSYARRRMAQKYPCTGEHGSDLDTGHYECGAPHLPDNVDGDKLHDRFTRWLMWHDRRTRELGHSPFVSLEALE